MTRESLRQQIDDAFTYHPPKDDQQIAAYAALRAKARELAKFFESYVPESRELSLALTKLQEAVMWANAGLAIHG